MTMELTETESTAIARYPIQLTLEQIHAIMSGKAITEKLFVRAGVHIELILMADDYEEVNDDDLPDLLRVMVVCPKCGNKRCPHATDSSLGCTGSNEPGQPGSKYQ